jgi:DNA-directed RNA polymerase subunit M/transcription elongation factor TFIIS
MDILETVVKFAPDLTQENARILASMVATKLGSLEEAMPVADWSKHKQTINWMITTHTIALAWLKEAIPFAIQAQATLLQPQSQSQSRPGSIATPSAVERETTFRALIQKYMYDNVKKEIDVADRFDRQGMAERTPNSSDHCRNPLCGKQTVFCSSFDTRASDEASTIFHECLTCGQKWRS